MTTTNVVDAARVELLLNELRLPSIRLMWAKLAEQSDKEGWPAARLLAALAEQRWPTAAAVASSAGEHGAVPPAAGKSRLATAAISLKVLPDSGQPDFWRRLCRRDATPSVRPFRQCISA